MSSLSKETVLVVFIVVVLKKERVLSKTNKVEVAIWQFLICLFLLAFVVSLLFLVVLWSILGHSTKEKLPYVLCLMCVYCDVMRCALVLGCLASEETCTKGFFIKFLVVFVVVLLFCCFVVVKQRDNLISNIKYVQLST